MMIGDGIRRFKTDTFSALIHSYATQLTNNQHMQQRGYKRKMDTLTHVTNMFVRMKDNE